MPIVGGRENGYPQKRNGRSRPGEQMGGCIHGEINFLARTWRISPWERDSAIARSCCRCNLMSRARVHTDFCIWPGTSGSGCRIGTVSYTHLTLPTSDLV